MDLISKLPDEVLHRIISMISFKEAIQTSTLSTSWRSLISTSHMIINHTSIQSSCHEYSKQTLKPILESNQAFQILKLYCSLCDQLLAVGTKGAHNELHLDFSGQKKLNPCKFNMILSQSSLTDCPKFSSLKILHLRSVSQLGGNLVNDLFSSCQLLESLKLEKCPGLEDLEIKSNGCLRKLEMLDCSNVVRVVIYAQKLESFSYGGFFVVIEIIESPNLVDITLDFREGLGKANFDCEDALSLLSNVQDVEILTVNSWLLEALCCAGVIFNKLDFQFSKLKNLLCICSKISSQMRDSLACFLNATPSLEELLVKIDRTSNPIECPISINQYWHEPHLWKDYATVKSEAHWLKDLKSIKILGFKREIDELMLMDLLLHNAINLKEMVVVSSHESSWTVARMPNTHLKYLKMKYVCISCLDIDSSFVLIEAKGLEITN